MKKLYTLILTVMLLSMMITGCGGQNMNGYTKMTNIDGVDFYVPTTLSNSATAITEISPDNNYDATSAYTYKDENGFLIFRMSEMVVAVQKGTTFQLNSRANNNERQNALKENSLLGIWFNIPNKFKDATEKLEGASKYICSINAEVVISTNLYDNFTGKLAIIETAGEEYSVFAGYKGEVYEDLSKEQQSTVESIINAFTLTTAVQSEASTQMPQATNAPTEVPTVEPTATPVPTEVPTQAPTEEPVTEQGGDEIIIEVPSTEVEPTAEPVTEPTAEPVSTATPAPTEAPTPEPTAEPVTDTPTAKPSIVLDNQNADAENSIYGLLPLNKTSNINMLQGYYTVNMTITPTELIIDEDAIEIIKNHCEKKDTLYEYTDAPVGCSWEVVKYTMSYEKSDMFIPYLNVKLIGLDGEALKYRGITYSKRTHDICISEQEKNGVVTKEMYCFYAVPNGCMEYALEMGDGTIHNEEESAYYLIEK